jgi:predicted RNA-binding protein YlxR (DUF448 family)
MFSPRQQADNKDCIPLMYAICGDCKEEREEMLRVDASQFQGADKKEGRGVWLCKMYLQIWA